MARIDLLLLQVTVREQAVYRRSCDASVTVGTPVIILLTFCVHEFSSDHFDFEKERLLVVLSKACYVEQSSLSTTDLYSLFERSKEV